MGRNKKVGLTELPQNIRLFVEDHNEIKRLAKKAGVPESEVHRALVSEALKARRNRAGATNSDDTPEARLDTLLEQLETALAEMKIVPLVALQDDVQTLSSRVEFLSAQIAQLSTAAQ